MIGSGDRLTKDLTVRYVAVLAIIGGLAVASFLGLVRILMDSRTGSIAIETAAQQRPLVERAVYAVNSLARPLDPGTRAAELTALSDSLDKLESAHFGLTTGIPGSRAALPRSPEVDLVLFGEGRVDHLLRGFVDNARAVLAKGAERLSDDDSDLQALAHGRVDLLLAGLDKLTAAYRQDNELRIRRLFLFHGIALTVTLALLVLSAAMVFRPMANRIKADIEDRAKASERLRESEDRLMRILEESPVGVSVSSRRDGKVVFANSRFRDIIGAGADDLIGSPARDLFRDEGQRGAVVRALKATGHIEDAEVEFMRRDGTPFWSLLTLRSTYFQQEAVNLAWVYDISAIKQAQASVRLTAKVVESASEAVVITNPQNVIEYVNPAFTTITGYQAEEVMGRDPGFLSSGRHGPEFYQTMWDAIRTTGRWRGEIWNRRKSGEFYAEEVSIVALRDDGGTITHYIAIFSDITHRKEDEERIWRQANYDALTGLPNRSLFMDRLQQAVRQSQRDDSRFAVLFLDLDGFKAVNDTLGHSAGDELLQQVAVRLEECIRATDTLARLAGDEFTCIVTGIQGRADVGRVAAKILDSLATPFQLSAGSAAVQASIGIAMFPDDAERGAPLLEKADQAMYAVKRSGKNAFRFAETSD